MLIFENTISNISFILIIELSYNKLSTILISKLSSSLTLSNNINETCSGSISEYLLLNKFIVLIAIIVPISVVLMNSIYFLCKTLRSSGIGIFNAIPSLFKIIYLMISDLLSNIIEISSPIFNIEISRDGCDSFDSCNILCFSACFSASFFCNLERIRVSILYINICNK